MGDIILLTLTYCSFLKMTTVDEFRQDITATLRYFDTILPNGSHVLIVGEFCVCSFRFFVLCTYKIHLLGLVDGRVLWDSLYNRTHPLGVPYKSMYNFLNCLQISPCWVCPVVCKVVELIFQVGMDE
jgi:acyloxyacyl hydrolase